MRISIRNALDDRGAAPPIILLLVTAVTAVLFFPGVLDSDSVGQLQEATTHHYTDWHPPVMAVVWSWLLTLTGQPGSLMLLHQLLYGVGFALFADGCRRAAMPGRAWLIVLASCFPLFVFYNRLVLKDVGMASALTAATGIQCWFLLQNRRLPWGAALCAIACLMYGTLVRINAVFAIGPLILIWMHRTRGLPTLKLVPVCLALSLFALPLSDWTNHHLLHAKRLDVMQQLQIYDLMGIEYHSGDESVWGQHEVPLSNVKSCYSPVWWDTFSTWGMCAWMRPKINHLGSTNSPEVVAERGALWRRAILKHPLAYIAHRLSHFNSSVYFLVPSFHIRYKSPSGDPPTDRENLGRNILLDYVKRTFLVWPITWIALGGCALVFITREGCEGAPARSFSKALILSGLLYSFAYLFVGIATEIRYHYWSIIAICIGCLLSVDVVLRGFVQRSLWGSLSRWLMIGIVVAGYAVRLADLPMPL